jgi:hypothetical protein
MTEIEYKESDRYPGYYTAYQNGQACGFVSKEQMDNQPVKIKHWQQDTMESGRWHYTDAVTRRIALRLIEERIFYRAEIVEAING